MKRKQPKKDSKKAIMKELDIAWAKKVKERDGVCAIPDCNRTSYLNAHHIFSRRYMNTRWNLDNGITLCRGCHLYFAHQKYEEFRDIALGILGVEGFACLKRESQKIKKWDKDELQELLQSF